MSYPLTGDTFDSGAKEAMQPATKIISAVAIFAGIHSVLASRAAKKRFAGRFGERRRNALYRPLYNVQAVVTAGALITYCYRLDDKPLWRVPHGAAMLLNSLRAGALAAMYLAARQVGLSRISGLANLGALVRGDKVISVEPEAQGPALDAGSSVTGPFRYTRHPLNFLAILLLWLAPRVTRNRFVFNSAATAYLLLGSLHEEKRLRETFACGYEDYCKAVRFLFGRKHERVLPTQLDQKR